MATQKEYLVTLGALGLLGIAGFGALGAAAGAAIAGDPLGGVPTSPRSAGRPTATPGAVVSAEAGLASAIDDFADAARGLYRDVPLKAPARGGLHPQFGGDVYDFYARMTPFMQRGDDITIEDVDDLLRAGNIEIVPAESGGVLRDFFVEFARLWSSGRIKTAERMADGPQSGEFVLGALEFGLRDAAGIAPPGMQAAMGPAFVDDLLAKAREAFAREGGVPEGFLERLSAILDIHRDGITQARRDQWFGGHAKSAMELLFDPLDGPAMTRREFLSELARDPGAALGALPAASRRYVEEHVLPVLRGELRDSTAEAEWLAAIATGDVLRVEELLGEAGERMALADLGRFAASLFSSDPERLAGARGLTEAEARAILAKRFPAEAGAAPALRPFSIEEAEALVRYPSWDDGALTARADGGETLARLLRAVDEEDPTALPGRPQELRDRALEEWLRAAARGHLVAAADFSEALAHVVGDLPGSLRDLYGETLRRFMKE